VLDEQFFSHTDQAVAPHLGSYVFKLGDQEFAVGYQSGSNTGMSA
jgi:hypothetical protein